MYFAILLSVVLKLVFGDGGYDYLAATNGLRHDLALTSHLNAVESEEDPISVLSRNIPGNGVPGEDYPILSHVPDTGFDCKEQGTPGYFADVDDQTLCQLFHICQEDGKIDSFLCPNGSVFNQQYFVCDWWFNVDCSESKQFYRLNENFGVIPEESQVQGRFDSVEGGYATPTRSDEKEEFSLQQSRSSFDDISLTQKYLAPQQRDASVDQIYRAPQFRDDASPAVVNGASLLRNLKANQLYEGPQLRDNSLITQSYQTPQLRDASVNQLYVAPQLREATVPRTYGAPNGSSK